LEEARVYGAKRDRIGEVGKERMFEALLPLGGASGKKLAIR